MTTHSLILALSFTAQADVPVTVDVLPSVGADLLVNRPAPSGRRLLLAGLFDPPVWTVSTLCRFGIGLGILGILAFVFTFTPGHPPENKTADGIERFTWFGATAENWLRLRTWR